jgi:hypothetical protein
MNFSPVGSPTASVCSAGETLGKVQLDSHPSFKPPRAKRAAIMLEICDTEQRYNESLANTLELYYKPLSAGEGLLDKREVAALFANLDAIHELSTVLLRGLLLRYIL